MQFFRWFLATICLMFCYKGPVLLPRRSLSGYWTQAPICRNCPIFPFPSLFFPFLTDFFYHFVNLAFNHSHFLALFVFLSKSSQRQTFSSKSVSYVSSKRIQNQVKNNNTTGRVYKQIQVLSLTPHTVP